MAGSIHNGPNGPGPCGAKPGGRGCPFDPEGTGENHFGTQEEAQAAYTAKMELEHGETATSTKKKGGDSVKTPSAAATRIFNAINNSDTGTMAALGQHREVIKVPHGEWKLLQKVSEAKHERLKAENRKFVAEGIATIERDGHAIRSLKAYGGTAEGVHRHVEEEYVKRDQNRLISADLNESWLRSAREMADRSQELIDSNPNAVAEFEALEKSVWSKRSEVENARIGAEYARSGAELTDPNRNTDGIKVPLGYSKQKAAYSNDGRLLGLDNSSSVSGPNFKLDGNEIKVRPSTANDPATRVQRNADKGFKLGYMFTPSSIGSVGDIVPVAQTAKVRDVNIPVTGDRAS